MDGRGGVQGNLGFVVAAGREPRWDWGQISLRPNLEYQVHPYHNVVQEVTVEQPETGVVRSESQNYVTVVRHGYRVFSRGKVELPVQKTLSVEVEGVLQVDLPHVVVRRPADTDHVEGVSVEMEGVTQIRLLH